MNRLAYFGLFLWISAFFGSCFPKDDEPSLEEQTTQIQAYLAQKGLTGKQTSTGIYYVTLFTSPLTRKPTKGEQITFSYQARYLDEAIIPNATGVARLPFGTGSINSQIEDALAVSPEGDSVKVFLFGNPLIMYNMKVQAIRSEAEQIAKIKVDSSYQTTVTGSGLEYIITTIGSGDAPVIGNTVTVKYTLRQLYGTLLDQSQGSAGTSFTLTTGGLISGFIESVLLLKEGGKGKFILPSSIAYGTTGSSSGVISPYTPLYFEIELVSVN
jgi:FKBP-type peptidyl-prolyl cis-trans isomerase 2